MKKINVRTQKGNLMYGQWLNSPYTELDEVYTSYSKAKEYAYENCVELCEMEHGERFRIISHNSNFFSVAWMTEEGLRVETAYNSYLVVFTPHN